MRPIRIAAMAMALMLAGCVRTPEVPSPAAGPYFDALTFFAGASDGRARLQKLFSPQETVRVESHGRMEGDTLVLDQRIWEGNKPARDRQWRIRRAGPDRYAGMLTDAVGPVSGQTQGNRLILRFPMKGGVHAVQWLTLAPDGRSAHNVLRFTKFGLTVAVLEETITRR